MKTANAEIVVEVPVVEIPAVAPEAWAWYNSVASLGGTRPRNWLPLAILGKVAQAIGRPLTQADLEILVHKDGEPVECAMCHELFQPVRYAVIGRRMLEKLGDVRDITKLNGELRFGGSHLVMNGKAESFCGPFFYFDPGRRQGDGSEYYGVNPGSCLVQVYQSNENRDHEGKPFVNLGRDEAVRLVKKLEQARQEDAEGFYCEHLERGKVIELGANNTAVVLQMEIGGNPTGRTCVINQKFQRKLDFGRDGIFFAGCVKEKHPKGIFIGEVVVFERHPEHEGLACGWAPVHEYAPVFEAYRKAKRNFDEKNPPRRTR
jgi:hypothetical protein